MGGSVEIIERKGLALKRFIRSFSLALGIVLIVTIPKTHCADKSIHWGFEYDKADRLTRISDPAGRATRIDYGLHDNGQLRQITRNLPDGSKVVYKFDRHERRVKMTDQWGSVEYDYDDLGRLVFVKRKGSPALKYSYDSMDRLKSISVGDDYSVGYGYDFLGRLKSIDSPAGKIMYQYQSAQGIIIRTLPNGIQFFMVKIHLQILRRKRVKGLCLKIISPY